MPRQSTPIEDFGYGWNNDEDGWGTDYNKIARYLDAISQLSALDKDLAAPPGSPAAGARYIVGAGATGAWAGKDGQIAYYIGGAWMFFAPREGWSCYMADEDVRYNFDGSTWVLAQTGAAIKVLYEAEANTNAFTDSEQAKLGYISVSQAVDLDAIEARVNGLDAAVILQGLWDASSGAFPGSGTTQAGDSWIVSIAGTVDAVAFAVGDRIIAIADNASTTTFSANWFKADYTDVYQTNAEIEAAYNAQVAAASQAEMEAGTEAAIRRMSPLRVAQAIAALGGGGGGGDLVKLSTTDLTGLANKDFDLSNSAYHRYRIEIDHLYHITGSAFIYGKLSNTGGATWATQYLTQESGAQAGAAKVAHFQANSFLRINGSVNFHTSVYPYMMIIDILGANSAKQAAVWTQFQYINNNSLGDTCTMFTHGQGPINYNGVNAFQLLPSTTTFGGGTATLYGVK